MQETGGRAVCGAAQGLQQSQKVSRNEREVAELCTAMLQMLGGSMAAAAQSKLTLLC